MKEEISSLVDVLNTVKSNDSSSEIGATAVLLIGDKDTREHLFSYFNLQFSNSMLFRVEYHYLEVY